LININYGHSKPIYEQVKDGLRQLMLSGVLSENQKLPSVRELAVKLTINPTPSSGPTVSWKPRATSSPFRARAALSPPGALRWKGAGRSCGRSFLRLRRSCAPSA